MLNLEVPVFLTGIGRSGSTAVHELMSYHPHAAWLTGFNDRFPERPEINRTFLAAIDVPGLGDLARREVAPGEAVTFWEHYCPGFRRPCRDLVADDLTERSRKTMPKVLARTLTDRRRRLVHKLTGWPRLGYLFAMCPDARFVHLLRDGRSVANSLLQVGFWNGWQGPLTWRHGTLPQDLQALWESLDRSFAGLAAIEWRVLMQAHRDAAQQLPTGRVLDVRYEDICADPVGRIREIAEFCQLPWSPRFERSVRAFPMVNNNDRWRRDLNARQQADIETVLAEALPQFGYTG